MQVAKSSVRLLAMTGLPCRLPQFIRNVFSEAVEVELSPLPKGGGTRISLYDCGGVSNLCGTNMKDKSLNKGPSLHPGGLFFF